MPDRSIRNVPVSTRRRAPSEQEFRAREAYRVPRPPQAPRHAHLWMWVLLAVVLCGAVGVALSLFFTDATITIIPRSSTVTLADTLTVPRMSIGESTDGLGFVSITASASTTRSVAASGTKNVTTTAQGNITIFNKYSSTSQPLIANTRFESPTGHTYRIHEAATVPGAKKNGDTLVPGSVSAIVYADKPGSEYNTGAVQFTIPGFINDKPKYNGFYATTESIAGGASGSMPSAKSEDIEKAKTDMQTELIATLGGRLQSQLPEGYILIPGALDRTFGDVLVEAGSGGRATLTEAAIVTAPAVSAAALAKAIATAAVEGYQGEPIDFANPSAIPVGLVPQTLYSSNATTLTLATSGSVTLVWQIDSPAVANAVVGKSKSDFQSIMQAFKPAVASARAALRPFWLTNFPGDVSKIKIRIK